MQQFLKHYRVKIRVLSPIHIGSGEKIKKKEYIYMPWNHRVIIPNVEKMYEDVCARGWEKEFTSFLMDSRNGEMPLSTWLAQKKLREADYEAWKLYEMDAGEAFVDRTSRPKEIDAFVKDAYGLPYAGSSDIFKNITTPISTIVVLRKGKENRIERLSLKEAFKYIYSETIINTWDEQFVNTAVDIILSTIRDIPVYLLSCLPNQDAVELLKSQIRGEF